MRLLPRGWPGTRSQDRPHGHDLSHPFHHFVTILLSRAIERHAQAICFGFRPDIVEDPGSRESWRQSAEELSAWLAGEQSIHSTMSVLERSAFARGPRGERGIPISFSVDGALRYFGQQPLNSYGMILATFQSRLVAIGASEAQPGPLRYIEIGYGMSKHPPTSHPQGRRRLVEVDLEFQADNSFWIHIRGEREVERSARISATIC